MPSANKLVVARIRTISTRNGEFHRLPTFQREFQNHFHGSVLCFQFHKVAHPSNHRAEGARSGTNAFGESTGVDPESWSWNSRSVALVYSMQRR